MGEREKALTDSCSFINTIPSNPSIRDCKIVGFFFLKIGLA